MSNTELCSRLIEQAVGIGYNEEKLILSRVEQDERSVICGTCAEDPVDCLCYEAAGDVNIDRGFEMSQSSGTLENQSNSLATSVIVA